VSGTLTRPKPSVVEETRPGEFSRNLFVTYNRKLGRRRPFTVATRPGVVDPVRLVATAPVRAQRVYTPAVGAQIG